MKHTLLACAVAATLLAATATASVVLNGTRIIYPASQQSKALHLTNEDAHPNLVQVWLARDEASTDDDASAAPFVVNPPIFRMAAHADQMVRLRFVGDESLPADRESVFYLNFTQVPALPDDQQDANQLVVLLQSRVKLFYRPRGLPAHDLSCASLRASVDGGTVRIENRSAYHVVISRAEMVAGGATGDTADQTTLPLAQAQMLAPFAQTRWRLPDGAGTSGRDTAAPAQTLRLWLRNDYGADTAYTCPLA